jgi:hypothetical protein
MRTKASFAVMKIVWSAVPARGAPGRARAAVGTGIPPAAIPAPDQARGRR